MTQEIFSRKLVLKVYTHIQRPDIFTPLLGIPISNILDSLSSAVTSGLQKQDDH